MKRLEHSRIKLVGLLALALGVAFGCSDSNDNDTPDPIIPIDTGGKSSGGKSSGGGKAGTDSGPAAGEGGSGNSGNTGNVGNTGGTTPQGDAGSGNEGGGGTIEPPECTLPERGPNDCYNCPKDNEPVQWLNRCVSGSNCVPFDNATRVPLAATVDIDVSLPALP